MPKPPRITNSQIQVQLVCVDKLIPNINNVRTHSEEQVAQIAASIVEFGWTNPILIRPDGLIIAGHARLRAARLLGMTEVPTIRLSGLSEAQCRALAIADNQLALNAGWDEELLRAQFKAFEEEDFDLKLLGFPDDEVKQLFDSEEPLDPSLDEDAAPDPPAQPVTATGDLWVLGNHRLLCGDATKSADVARLMANQTAALLFSDPPYNVDYEGYARDHLKIQGDHMSSDRFQQFLTDAFQSCRPVLKPEASLYVCHASATQIEFQ